MRGFLKKKGKTFLLLIWSKIFVLKDNRKLRNKRVSFWIGCLFLFFSIIIFFLPSGLIFWKMKQEEKESRKIFQETKSSAVLADPTSIKFLYFTDAHCYYDKNNLRRNNFVFNWRCVKPADEIRETVDENTEFIIEGGDLIDGGDKSEFSQIEKNFLVDNLPFYHVLGNHELRGFYKNDWLEITGNQRTYYYFDIREYRFIVLDGNFYSELEGEKDITPEHEFFPGLISEKEFLWLRRVLARSKDKTVLVFLHQVPVKTATFRASGYFLNKRESLQQLFSQYGVKAVFSGHIEELCSQEIDGVDYYLMKGFWKPNGGYIKELNKDKGFFYQINIDKDKELNIEVFFNRGKDSHYQSFLFDKSQFRCDNLPEKQNKELEKILEKFKKNDE